MLVDHSRHHFPIRGFEKLLRTAPRPIEPQERLGPSIRSGKFLVQLGEEGDDPSLPLLRLLIRPRLPEVPRRDRAG